MSDIWGTYYLSDPRQTARPVARISLVVNWAPNSVSLWEQKTVF